MFPLLRNRAARALDLAIEFATLGEYGWEASPTQSAPARGANRRAVPAEPHQGAPARPAARLVAPASAAAVALRPAPVVLPTRGPSRVRAVQPPTPAVAASTAGRNRPKSAPAAGVAQLALDFEGTVATPPVRSRGGSAPAAPQPCASPRR